MATEDTSTPRDDDRNDDLDDSPVPHPEEGGDAEDVPEAD